MKNIVVTGFEPFGGAERNASWEAVRGLEGVRTVCLPVTFTGAAERVCELLNRDPDIMICVGEAGGRDRISLERVAVNLMDARIPDNAGYQPVDVPVRVGRPAAWFTALPVREMMKAAEACGVPAELSYTAGTYVCNAVFYTLMDERDRQGKNIPAGFIHVPRDMETGRVREALRAMIRCLSA